MFGRRYWGARFFGPRYWGDGAVSDVDFADWLAAPNKRCVLAEFSAVGFDPDASPAQTKTVYAYISNMGYTSKPTDDPPNQHYNAWIKRIPTFRREMGVALSGRATNGFGSLVVSNPASTLNGPGVRDDWLRMKWKRQYITLYLGDKSWAKADFRKILVGTLGQPTGTQGEIEFPIADLGELFNGLLQTDKFDSGPHANRYKPLAVGMPAWCDLPQADPPNLVYQMNGGPTAKHDETNGIEHLYDNGVLIPDISRSDIAADPATNTFSIEGSPDTHGYVDGSVMYMVVGAPAGLSNLVEYYIVNATALTWQVSATVGGSPIDFSTTEGLTFLVNIYPYRVNRATGEATLLTQPSPRVTAYLVAQGSGTTDYSDAYVHNMLDYVIFEKGGVSTAFKDSGTFSALGTALGTAKAGVWFNGQEQVTIADALERITRGTNTWFGITPDGFIQVGLLDLPESTAVMDFTDSNTRDLALTNTIRPVNFYTESDVTYFQPNLDSPLHIENEFGGYPVEKTYMAQLTEPTPSVPLDSYPGVSDTRNPKVFDLIYTLSGQAAEQERLIEFYKRTIGIFTFKTKVSAIALRIGQTISLTHPRMGWKMYEGPYDPTSPDNTEDFDATKAVVIGVDVNLSANDPFPVKLTVFRQIPGYYPEENLN